MYIKRKSYDFKIIIWLELSPLNFEFSDLNFRFKSMLRKKKQNIVKDYILCNLYMHYSIHSSFRTVKIIVLIFSTPNISRIQNISLFTKSIKMISIKPRKPIRFTIISCVFCVCVFFMSYF